MAQKDPLPPPKQTEMLIQRLQSPEIKDNPYNFVMFVFPWGQKGTPLEKKKGPREWQKEALLEIAENIRTNKGREREGLCPEVFKSATISGRGPGKSTLVAWLALWQFSCQLGSSVIVTANTHSQLTSKTFAEIDTWLTLAIHRYWFEPTQTRISPAPWFAEAVKKQLGIGSQYWYIDGVLWNEDNPDAFVGAHNPKGLMLMFDEASGIPQPIWTVSRGFFTDISCYRFWLVYSNPRSNTGPLFDCFHQFHEDWRTRQIDSRSVEGLDQKEFNEIIKQFGEDSDEARIEVKGQFPKVGDRQFISRSVVMDATVRELQRYDDFEPLLMGVDPARFGDDSTVIRFRRGRDARSIPAVTLKSLDNVEVANRLIELIHQFDPKAVFIDAGGGAGIIDILRHAGYKPHEVDFGSASTKPKYSDHRTEMWGDLRDWLPGAMLPRPVVTDQKHQDTKLINDLCTPEYEYFGREDKLKLEAKEKMKKRCGSKSPDNADALALTFHCKIAPDYAGISRNNPRRRSVIAKGVGYDIPGY